MSEVSFGAAHISETIQFPAWLSGTQATQPRTKVFQPRNKLHTHQFKGKFHIVRHWDASKKQLRTKCSFVVLCSCFLLPWLTDQPGTRSYHIIYVSITIHKLLQLSKISTVKVRHYCQCLKRRGEKSISHCDGRMDNTSVQHGQKTRCIDEWEPCHLSTDL